MSKLFLGLVGCVIAWISGESSAQAVTHSETACDTNPNYVLCLDADTWTANCTLGSETACWTDNGASSQIVSPFDGYRQWRVRNTCRAAVGNGCYEGILLPGSTGPGYNFQQFSTVAPHNAQVTMRYYYLRSEGYTGFSSHGPAMMSLTGASTSCSTMAIQPAAYTFNLLYTVGGTCSSSLDSNSRSPRLYMNLTDATASGLCYNERWCRIELFLQKETTVTDADADNLEDQGECNGIVRLWIEDVLVLEHTDFCFGMMSYSGSWASNNSGFATTWAIREYNHRGTPWPGRVAIDNFVVDVGAHSGTGPYIGAAPNENYLGVADPNSPYYVITAAPDFWACYNTSDGIAAGFGCGNDVATQAVGTWGGRKTSSDCSGNNSFFGSEIASGQQWPAGTGSAGTYNFDTYVNSGTQKIETNVSYCGSAVLLPVREASIQFSVTASACVSNVTCGQGYYSDHFRGALEGVAQTLPTTYSGGTCSYVGTRACGPSFMPKVKVISGWIYIPSSSAAAFTNCETGTLIAASAFPTAQPCPALMGFGASASGNGGVYLAVTRTATGNFAVVQRHANNYLKRALYDSGTPISLDTWHKYELIAWVDLDTAADRDKVSLMLDGNTVITKQALTYTIASDDGAGLTNGEDWLNCKSHINTAAPSQACGTQGKWVNGIVSNQTGYDLTVLVDSTYMGTMSFYSCSGWGTWCPFETHKVGNLGGL